MFVDLGKMNRDLHTMTVIAGFDPTIQRSLMNSASFAGGLDCRVKPGDTKGGGNGASAPICVSASSRVKSPGIFWFAVS
jgi:hypothetical protein